MHETEPVLKYARPRHAARELTYYHDEDGCLVIRARLSVETGAVVLKALEATMDAQSAEAGEAASENVTAETLAGNEDGRSEFECGPRLASDTARRIACDGSWLRITEDADGNPLNIGSNMRAVPLAFQRALRARDGGCRFPRCTHHRFVDAHHIRHWANGSATSLDNLV